MTYFADEVERVHRLAAPRADVLARIMRAKRYIDENYAEPLCLDLICGKANTSKFQFIRQFKRIVGRSPRQYLIDVRVRRAKELLLSGYPVNEACLAVGYNSAPAFSYLVKKMTGRRPSAFKNSNFQ